jgi:hypothetical protein
MTAIKSAIMYSAECYVTKGQHIQKMGVVEIRMLHWICVIQRDIKSEMMIYMKNMT